MVGYKTGTIAKYEQGDRVPNIGIFRKIAEVLECNLADIADMTDDVILETIRFDEAVEDYISLLGYY